MSRNRTALIVEVAVIALVLAFATRAFAQQAKNLCLDCHSAMDGNLQIIAQDYSSDIHAQKGLSCASCHGGDPSSDENAMNAKAGFRGHIDRKQIPQLCGSCHSDVAKMRQYNPSLRTDQSRSTRPASMARSSLAATRMWPSASIAMACMGSVRPTTRAPVCTRSKSPRRASVVTRTAST
jgi:Cytochrome c3